MSMRDAKDLHADITKLLLAVTALQAQLLDAQKQPTFTVEVAGQDF
jgi:hypothetical protein